MSRKSAENMSSNAEVPYSKGKVHPSYDGSQPMCELYLDELTLGATGVIIVMICRSWDVHTLTGRYASMDFVMSDAKMSLDTLQIEDKVSLSQAAVDTDYSQAKEGTVKIDDTRSQKGWNFPACGGEKCKKGVVQKNGSFWCHACEKAVDYPVLRFRHELYVSDKTASTIVVMFDEPAKELLKCSADSLAAADDESGFGYTDHAGLPFALANIIGTTHTLEMKSHTYYEHGTVESFTCWRIAQKREELEDSDNEVTGDMDDGGMKCLTMHHDAVLVDCVTQKRRGWADTNLLPVLPRNVFRIDFLMGGVLADVLTYHCIVTHNHDISFSNLTVIYRLKDLL
nr:hypothetical protein [Tanacetum cinerariifolium]